MIRVILKISIIIFLFIPGEKLMSQKCLYTNDKIQIHLKALGFAEYTNMKFVIEQKEYSGLLKSSINIILVIDSAQVPLTDELNSFLDDLTEIGNTSARVSIINESNCDIILPFKELDPTNNIYTEDIIFVEKEGERRIFYKIQENLKQKKKD